MSDEMRERPVARDNDIDRVDMEETDGGCSVEKAGAGSAVEAPPGMSRRKFLLVSTAAASGLVVGGLAVGGCTDEPEVETATTEDQETTSTTDEQAAVGEDVTAYALTALTATEAETLRALLDRLIPSDDVGPGAVEAGVVRYIDRALSSDLGPSLNVVQHNIGRLDTYAEEQEGATFGGLDPETKDQIINRIENDEADGFSPSSAGFFSEIRELALQGMFGDPFYGGNVGTVGWDLIHYPGIRVQVPPEQQGLGQEQTGGRRSTYEFEMFGLSRQEGS